MGQEGGFFYGKRGNGEGSIYFSDSKKRWVGQFTVGYKIDGTINRKTIYGKTRTEVKDKLNKSLSDIKTNTFIEKNNIGLILFMRKIIDDKYNSNIIADRSYNRIMGTINIIEKFIGNIEIQKITENNLREFMSFITNYSNSTIEKIYGLLNMTF